QPGVAAIAARTGLPVIPVLTDSGRFWGRLAFRKRPGTIRLTLLAPIPVGTPRHELMRLLSPALAREPSEPVENSVHQAIAGCGGQSTP
ncbi:MAG: 1-acyl-sn-glycerol-3-phosphate acyltransferase, partial [Acetobacteraceae bacterium]|nr:1-acyl-sn-glycerol-3-phosphate acyltransferase [Acetobacteraceae bacterium]